MTQILDAVEARGFNIEWQSQEELLLIMRSIYYTNRGATEQALVEKCVATSVDIIMANIELHKRATLYLYENPDPVDRGVNTNIRGTRLTGGA